MRISITSALLLAAVSATPTKRSTTLIPSDAFGSTESLEKYFDNDYPWGPSHNGGACMIKENVAIDPSGTLTITSKPLAKPANDPSNSNLPEGCRKRNDITYTSGTVHAKQLFTVPPGGGLVFRGKFKAPVVPGTWPAFWLTGTSWPPEIDLAEWKGTGKVSFNTYNSSSSLTGLDVQWPNPDKFNKVRVEIRDNGDGAVKVDFYIQGKLITTQYGADYVGKQMWLVINLQMLGSSGKTGPTGTTTYQVKELSVTTL